MEFQLRYLALSSFVSKKRLRIVMQGKSSQQYPVNAGVSQGPILGLTLFLVYINDLSVDVICNIAIYTDDTTIYSKCDEVSDLWQQLELASELESDLWDTVDWGRKWLVDFNTGKSQLVQFYWFNKTDAIDAIMAGSVPDKLDLFLKLSKKIVGLIHFMKFLSAEVTLYLYESTIQPCMEYCYHVWAVASSC